MFNTQIYINIEVTIEFEHYLNHVSSKKQARMSNTKKESSKKTAANEGSIKIETEV
jgi:hypothetical protein